MNEILETIGIVGLVPVITLDRAEDAPRLGAALLDGGLPCAEITFRTPVAADAIHAMLFACPAMIVGAGTVLSVPQAEQAVAAGASFIVSPGFDDEVVDWCARRQIAVLPGVATPTDVMAAIKWGLEVVKFFPAESFGGVGALRAISASFPGLKFMPTGGITAANLADYLRLPAVHACGGSWMASRELIAGGRFDAITRLAREAINIVAQVRSEA